METLVFLKIKSVFWSHNETTDAYGTKQTPGSFILQLSTNILELENIIYAALIFRDMHYDHQQTHFFLYIWDFSILHKGFCISTSME